MISFATALAQNLALLFAALAVMTGSVLLILLGVSHVERRRRRQAAKDAPGSSDTARRMKSTQPGAQP